MHTELILVIRQKEAECAKQGALCPCAHTCAPLFCVPAQLKAAIKPFTHLPAPTAQQCYRGGGKGGRSCEGHVLKTGERMSGLALQHEVGCWVPRGGGTGTFISSPELVLHWQVVNIGKD